MEAPNSSHLVRFGVFEANLKTGELRKQGVRIKIQEQPFQVLAMLLEKPGEIITREEIQKHLWPENTFVDFDHSLNKAINKIRDALCDSADNPRFVETLARRGYRFIAPVTINGTDVPQTALVQSSIFPVELNSNDKVGISGNPKSLVLYWLSIILVLGVSLAIVAWFWVDHSRPAKEETPLTILPFTSFHGNELYPSFSPDGQEVAFSWTGGEKGNFDIYRKMVGLGEPLRLTNHSFDEICPAWSPDGRYITFIRALQGPKWDVILIPALGGAERKLSDLAYPINLNPPYLSWTPESKAIALVDKASPDAPYSIFLFLIESGEKHQLTFPPAKILGDTSMAFSPDGRTLVFTRKRDSILSDLYLLKISEHYSPVGEPIRITFDNMAESFSPAWAADGSEIVFISRRLGSLNLWRTSLEHPNSLRLIAMKGDPSPPIALSRQGNRLIYAVGSMDVDIWKLELAKKAITTPI
jgi:DNA-binding winged helix-turn-helix (wHTH) protein